MEWHRLLLWAASGASMVSLVNPSAFGYSFLVEYDVHNFSSQHLYQGARIPRVAC